jgi:uncharacterized membrane protein YccC
MIDVAIGEAADLRYRSRILQTAVGGLLETILTWRMVARCRRRPTGDNIWRDAERIGRELLSKDLPAPASELISRTAELRDVCSAATGRLASMEAETPSMQLLADAAAEGMVSMTRTLNGLTLVVDPEQTIREGAATSIHVPDWLPAFIVALRAFVTIAAVSLFWIVTAWSSGALAITFAAAVAIVFSLQGDQAYSASINFLLGCCLSAVLAGVLVFWLLPGVVTFPGLCLALGLALVPLSFFIALPWQPVFFSAAAINVLPMLSLSNTMGYNEQQFYNSNLAILAGIAVATMAMRLLPPPSPEWRTRRLLALSLGDMQRLGRRHSPTMRRRWEGRTYARLIALPEQAEPLQRAQMASLLVVGTQIIRLRTVGPRFLPGAAIDAALNALSEGRTAVASKRLQQADQTLAALADLRPRTKILLRLRASILAISHELAEFAYFFDSR